MEIFLYKSVQESILIESLVRTQLISKRQLLEIKKLYHENVPYHNFLHALNVAQGVLKLPTSTYNIIEIKSLFISALFHDAGHKGVAEGLDEFQSLDMAFEGIMSFEKKYNYTGIDYSIVRKSIIGTVFKNRVQNKNKYAILLADLDVSTIGMSFPEFLYYADFPFSLESGVNIEKWLRDISFFKFLMSVEKNVFRTPKVREIFPEYLNNIRKYTQSSPEKIKEIFLYWKNNDISYSDFEKFFQEKF